MSGGAEERPGSELAEGLRSLVNDIFLGLIRAGRRLPGGMALAEDILREAAAATASRMLKQYPPTATADAFEAIQSHNALLAESGIVPAGGVEVTRGSSGRVRVSVKPEHCLFAAHCGALMAEALECPCPKRLYTERMAAAATGKSMGSVVIECARRGECSFDVFAVSAEMAGPIERARRNMAAVALEREAAKSALSRLEAQHNSILTTIADAIILADNEWRVTYANPRACDILGADLDGAVGARLDGGSFGRIAERCVEAARAGDGISGSTKLEDRDGEDIHRIYLARFSRVRARDGSDTGTLIVLEDVTREELLKKELAAQARNLEKAVAEKTRELEAANASLAKLARTDSLTGLPNRRTFEETLVGEIERASRYGYTTGVVMVDVDDFKSVNDRHGHQAGDSVLRHAAMILSKSVRSTDAVARFGGDEFSILLPQAGIAECEAVARRISENLLIENASASRVRGVQLSLSVGWAADGGRSAESLLARADEMMYDSKASKKARVPQDAARR